MKQDQVMDIGLPQGMNVVNMGDSLEITRRWFSCSYIVMTFFTLFWLGFLGLWYSTALQNKGASIFPVLLFPLLHVGIGIFLAYSTLAGYLNTTTVRVDWSTLSIHHGPLPWPGNQTIDARDIKQIYVKEHISRSRRGGTSVTYQVHALTHSGKNLQLLSGLPNDEQALFIEQEIEKFLRIQDVPVRGEYGQWQ